MKKAGPISYYFEPNWFFIRQWRENVCEKISSNRPHWQWPVFTVYLLKVSYQNSVSGGICLAIFAHVLNKRLVMDKCQHLRTNTNLLHSISSIHTSYTHICTLWTLYMDRVGLYLGQQWSGETWDTEWLCLRIAKGCRLNQNDA